MRRNIRMTLLDRCTHQVRKALLAAHPEEEIEHLECKVMDFMTWLRKAAQDPTMSTYMRKTKAMSDYAVAKQFLSEIDEVWVERIERLASKSFSTCWPENPALSKAHQVVEKVFYWRSCAIGSGRLARPWRCWRLPTQRQESWEAARSTTFSPATHGMSEAIKAHS